MKIKLKLIIFPLILFLIIGGFVAYQLFSPKRIVHREMQKEVLGFIPYWVVNEGLKIPYDAISSIAYFGWELDSDGKIITNDNGYRTYKTEIYRNIENGIKYNDVNYLITIVSHKNQDIEKFHTEDGYKESITKNILNELKTNKNIDGVVLNFEWFGVKSGDELKNFQKHGTDFINYLGKSLKDEGYMFYVSVPGKQADGKGLYNYKNIEKDAIDYIFLMTYDYQGVGYEKGAIAGPNAPLYNNDLSKNYPSLYPKSTPWNVDYHTSLLTEVFDSKKILIGIPFYGNIFPVAEKDKDTFRAPIIGEGKIDTLGNAIYRLTLYENIEVKYNEEYNVHWYTYYLEDTNTYNQVYIEMNDALKKKYQYTYDKNLGGIGIWAIGFELHDENIIKGLQESF